MKIVCPTIGQIDMQLQYQKYRLHLAVFKYNIVLEYKYNIVMAVTWKLLLILINLTPFMVNFTKIYIIQKILKRLLLHTLVFIRNRISCPMLNLIQKSMFFFNYLNFGTLPFFFHQFVWTCATYHFLFLYLFMKELDIFVQIKSMIYGI